MSIRSAMKNDLDITLEDTDKLYVESGVYADNTLLDVTVIDKFNKEHWIGIYNPKLDSFIF